MWKLLCSTTRFDWRQLCSSMLPSLLINMLSEEDFDGAQSAFTWTCVSGHLKNPRPMFTFHLAQNFEGNIFGSSATKCSCANFVHRLLVLHRYCTVALHRKLQENEIDDSSERDAKVPPSPDTQSFVLFYIKILIGAALISSSMGLSLLNVDSDDN